MMYTQWSFWISHFLFTANYCFTCCSVQMQPLLPSMFVLCVLLRNRPNKLNLLKSSRQSKPHYKQVSRIYSCLCQMLNLKLHWACHYIRFHPVACLPGFPCVDVFPSHNQPTSFSHVFYFFFIWTSHCMVMTPWKLINASIDFIVKCEIRCMDPSAIHQNTLAYN